MSSVRLEASEGGVLLPVQAHPKARRNAITGEHDGRLKVSVTHAPEKGKANQAIRSVLAKTLAVKNVQLHLVSGETSAKKQFLVTGETLDSLRERIARCLEGL